MDAHPDGRFAAYEELADFVTVIDAGGTIVFANSFAERLLGLDRSATVGHNITEFLHPDDLERALRVMGMVVGQTMGVAVTPAVYRIAGADGTWTAVELNGSMLASGLVAIVGRYSGDRELQDEIMERLIAGDAPTDVVEVIPHFGRWRHPEDHYAVFFTGDDGQRRSAGSRLACALGEMAEAGAPWQRAAATGDDVLAGLDDMALELRSAASAAGLSQCWARPVEDPSSGQSAVIVAWGRAGGSSMEVHRYALDTMARLLALILRWRQQVTGLRKAARHDPLTGLPNRTGFWEMLESVGDKREQVRVGVLYIDLDGFKAVNDQFGHRVGDFVLAEVGQRITAVLRPRDVVARLGGDEFAVLCPDLLDEESAIAIAERVVVSLQRPFLVGEASISIGASVGIAVARPGDLEADDLVDAADRALYQAKEQGRGRWHLGPSRLGSS